MAGVTVTEFLADQLRASNPRGDWNAAGVDRLHELAEMLASIGITSILDIAFEPQKRTVYGCQWQGGDAGSEVCEDSVVGGLVGINTRTGARFGFIGEPGKPTPEEWCLRQIGDQYRVAWSPIGHGHVNYLLTKAEQGFTFAPIWESSSDLGDIRQGVMTVLPIVLTVFCPLAGVSVAASIGETVIGAAAAAAYPGLAGLVGNVALGVAFSGGNVEAAVKGAVLSYVGGAAGQYVSGGVVNLTGVDLAGKVAASVTSAAITGKDISKAAAFSLLSNGVTSLPPLTNGGAMGDDVFTFDDSTPINATFGEIPLIAADPYGIGAAIDTSLPPVISVPYVANIFDPMSNMFEADPLTPTYDYTPNLFPTTTYTGGLIDGGVYNNTPSGGANLQQVTAAAMAALQVIAAFKNGGQQIQNPNNITQRATSNGLITQTAGGKVTTARPAPGVAMLTNDGGVVVNNGNGTYDYVNAAGVRSTKNYPSSNNGGAASLLNMSPTSMLVLCGAVLLLMSNRRG